MYKLGIIKGYKGPVQPNKNTENRKLGHQFIKHGPIFPPQGIRATGDRTTNCYKYQYIIL